METKEHITARLRIPYIHTYTVFFPVFSIVSCIAISILYHFEDSVKTHCKNWQWFPSVSSAVGNNAPQKYLFRLFIGLYSYPKIIYDITVFLVLRRTREERLLRYNDSISDFAFNVLSKVDMFAHVIENLLLYILTMVSSNDDHLIHVLAFAFFMLFAHISMVTHLQVLKHARIRFTDYETKTYNLRKFFGISHFLVFMTAIYLYWRHNQYCEDGVFSVFGMCEFTVIVMNILYHSVELFEFKNVEYRLILNSDSIKIISICSIDMILEIFHWQSIAASIFLFVSYILTSSFLQYYFYTKHKENYQKWKVEPKSTKSFDAQGWWLPFFNHYTTKERAPNHGIYASVNLLLSCIVCAISTELIIRRKSYLYYDITEHSIPRLLIEFVLPHIYQNVLEYYWHRFLHLPYMYKRFHKVHHYYKNPEPFDDMYIHPLEAFIYYLILFSPPFVINMHASCFLAYMAVCGVTGILDHSGIKFSIPLLYNTEDHDAHHSKFECNYAFPFPFLDIFHGTYSGKISLLGFTKRIKPTRWANRKSDSQKKEE